MSIIYIPNNEINKKKWDSCIDHAPNGNVYAYSYYLDHVSKHWDALVSEDYEMVMPLTWNRKYGIYYLYQPFFTASLGVFGQYMTKEKVKAFLQSIPARFRYWDIYLNHSNLFADTGFPLYDRMNYVLDLNKPYEELYSNFSESHKRNIKKAESSSCVFNKDISIDEIIHLSARQSKSFSPAKKSDYENFKSLYQYMYGQGKAQSYGVMLGEKLVASCAFFFSHGRAYYIIVGNHPDGRTIGASQFMLDEFVRGRVGTNLILDFEGSQIPGLASFYSGFGGVEEKYAGVKVNKLPAAVKLFKK